MKTILFTGDSHTCGEYADGFSADDIKLGYDPKGLGVGRHLPLDSGGYTNLVYKYVCKKTNSSVQELNARQLSQIYGLATVDNNIILNRPLTIKTNCDQIQIMFGLQTKETRTTVVCGGKEIEISLVTQKPRFGNWSFRWLTFNGGSIDIIPQSEVYISFIRYCSGKWTCINSGVGSCTSVDFKNNFFPFNVLPFAPDIIIAEPHTINDWLSGCTPTEYSHRVKDLLKALKDNTKKLFLMTVSPILGPQSVPFNNYEYSLFTKAAIKAANDIGVPVIDSGADIERYLYNLDEGQVARHYKDNWHLRQVGHELYAQSIINAIDNFI